MNIKLAENLQLLRKEKGLTQEDVASKFGVTNQSVSKWESGTTCPDITLLPDIAQFYKVSVDELLGYKPMTSINSIYLQMKSFIDSSDEEYFKPDWAYRLARLSATTLWSQQQDEVDKLLTGKKTFNLSYIQRDGGVSICGDNTLFLASFKDFRRYDISTIRKVSKYLNKLANLNTLKVLFGLFNMTLDSTIKKTFTIKEIKDYTNLDEGIINKAFNDLDIYFDKEHYEKTGEEKYSLEHIDQVPILVTMLIPSLGHYDNQLMD